MLTDNVITITDKTIVDFYHANPNINIVSINLFFLDIIQKLTTNLTSTLNESNISKILSIITDINSTVNSLDISIQHKLLDMKKNYMDDIKDILNSNSLSNEQYIRNALERNQDNMLTKTTLILNDHIPKNQEIYSKLEKTIHSHFTDITNTTNLLLTQNKQALDKESIMKDLDVQLNKLVSLVYQPICAYIQSSEQRTTSQIESVKENISSQKQSNELLSSELNVFLNKYKNNSSSKGNVSETELYYILQRLMPSDEIIRCSSDTASGDFKIIRHDKQKPNILFENKHYTRSVDTEEIKKFERDVAIQKMHGIFLSQNSPITFKNTFHIDVVNGFIMVYVPNVEYNVDKIRIAIDIIDSLSIQIQLLQETKSEEEDASRTMNSFILSDIIREYIEFGKHKMDIVETVKSHSKLLLEKIDALTLPNLNAYLQGTGQYKNEDFICPHCHKFNGRNKASLSTHIRHCKLNPAIKPAATPVV